MAIDTMETELVESCCEGVRVTGPCVTKLPSIKTLPVEQPPPTPDNHGPKKPVRKPRQYSINVECPRACLAFSATMARGQETHEEDAWRDKSVKELLVHVERHIALYLIGDTSEEHLKHATTRLVMALDTAELRGMRT